MKSLKFIIILICTSLFLFSCKGFIEGISFSKYEGEIRTEEWTPTEDNPVYELTPSVGTLKINGKSQSEVYFVRLNPSSFFIPRWQTRYVTSSNGQRQAMDSKEEWSSSQQLIPSLPEFVPVDYAPARDFVPPHLNSPSTRSASIAKKDYSVLQKEAELGDSRYLYTDDANTREWATLKFKGEHCNIWVVDGHYTSEAIYYGSTQVNTPSLIYLATQFDKAYPIVHTLFGQEQDYILGWNGERISINEKVNIVIYDIKKDTSGGGTVGFFWGKDFYTSDVLSHSNEGKFFYLDAYWVCNFIEITSSTLVHEFQHMINHSSKPGSSIWFNEMLSLLCEEALQKKLQIADSNNPRSRLSQFCEGYWKGGLTTWGSGDDVMYSYARSYAFGAFLLRNYGGIQLLQNIALNPYVNETAIEEGLRASGINKNFEQVFTEFVLSLILSDENTNSLSLNRSVNQTINEYEFSLPAIDLNNYYVRRLSSGKIESGPLLFDAGIRGQLDLAPYGFSFHKVGLTKEDGSLTLNFSEVYLTGEKGYILVK